MLRTEVCHPITCSLPFRSESQSIPASIATCSSFRTSTTTLALARTPSSFSDLRTSLTKRPNFKPTSDTTPCSSWPKRSRRGNRLSGYGMGSRSMASNFSSTRQVSYAPPARRCGGYILRGAYLSTPPRPLRPFREWHDDNGVTCRPAHLSSFQDLLTIPCRLPEPMPTTWLTEMLRRSFELADSGDVSALLARSQQRYHPEDAVSCTPEMAH